MIHLSTGRLAASRLAAAILLLAAPAAAQETEAPPRYISVMGTGEATAAPDVAHVMVGVTTEAPLADEALAENSRRMDAIFAALREVGVEDRDMQTAGLNLSPRWDNRRMPDGNVEQRQAGFVASNTLRLRMRDLDALGGALDRIASAGANQIHGIQFDILEKDELLDVARRGAVADARRRAEILADSAGVALGHVISISEGGPRYGPPQPRMMNEMASADVPMARGEAELSASVQIVYAVE